MRRETKKRFDRRLEIAAFSIEKKGRFSGKKHFEALIDGNLRIVVSNWLKVGGLTVPVEGEGIPAGLFGVEDRPAIAFGGRGGPRCLSRRAPRPAVPYG